MIIFQIHKSVNLFYFPSIDKCRNKLYSQRCSDTEEGRYLDISFPILYACYIALLLAEQVCKIFLR